MVRYGDENEPRGTLDKLAPLFCVSRLCSSLASGVRSVVLVELPLKCFLGKAARWHQHTPWAFPVARRHDYGVGVSGSSGAALAASFSFLSIAASLRAERGSSRGAPWRAAAGPCVSRAAGESILL